MGLVMASRTCWEEVRLAPTDAVTELGAVRCS